MSFKSNNPLSFVQNTMTIQCGEDGKSTKNNCSIIAGDMPPSSPIGILGSADEEKIENVVVMGIIFFKRNKEQ